MNLHKTICALSLTLLFMASPVQVLAGDFDWLKQLNITAVNDPSGFKTRLAARFQVGEAQISTVINNVKQPADAYMVLRLGELSGRPADDVIKTYQADKDKGWGAMAKKLGIKPGSKEFHALKRGGDMHDSDGHDDKKKDKSHGKDKSEDKGKGNGKH